MNIIKVQYADGYDICRHARFIVLKQLLGRGSYTMSAMFPDQEKTTCWIIWFTHSPVL